MDIGELVGKYGFPIIAAGGMGYFIYFIWQWTTEEVSPVLKEANTVLIGLIDRVRRLDNDLIRLNQSLITKKQICYNLMKIQKNHPSKDEINR
jgi:hypothetical protein